MRETERSERPDAAIEAITPSCGVYQRSRASEVDVSTSAENFLNRGWNRRDFERREWEGERLPRWTRALHAIAGPLYPVWKALFPKYVTTTEELGRAMVRVAKVGYSKPIFESAEIAEAAGGRSS